MPTGSRTDPFGNYNFLLEIDGIARARFSEVSGLDTTIEVIEYREGGDLGTIKLPGRVSYSNISLRWGMTDDTELYEWILAVAQGTTERKNGSIILLDRQGNEISRWNFFNAFPASYKAPDLKASGNEVAIESLDLAHERLERVR